jgi:hypothetical protein
LPTRSGLRRSATDKAQAAAIAGAAAAGGESLLVALAAQSETESDARYIRCSTVIVSGLPCHSVVNPPR